MRQLLLGGVAATSLLMALHLFRTLDPEGHALVEAAARSAGLGWGPEACARLPEACARDLQVADAADLARLRAHRAEIESAAARLHGSLGRIARAKGVSLAALQPTPKLTAQVRRLVELRDQLNHAIVERETQLTALPVQIASLDAGAVLQRLGDHDELVRVIESTIQVETAPLDAFVDLEGLVSLGSSTAAPTDPVAELISQLDR